MSTIIKTGATERRAPTLTPFGLFLQKKGISDADAAAALHVTRQQINGWAHGRATPAMPRAFEIEKWAKSLGGDVGIYSWKPWVKGKRS